MQARLDCGGQTADPLVPLLVVSKAPHLVTVGRRGQTANPIEHKNLVFRLAGDVGHRPYAALVLVKEKTLVDVVGGKAAMSMPGASRSAKYTLSSRYRRFSHAI
ncbi:hypothetical protein MFIFM68171_02769 [Madurella fahalii]|uniref:Uncharacterized protein n=1 Tax=Madurella fahalii TaxID=1157608 RepID=A0ABQ0G481_9PEZI